MRFWYVARAYNENDDDDYCALEKFSSRREAKNFLNENNEKYNDLFIFSAEEEIKVKMR